VRRTAGYGLEREVAASSKARRRAGERAGGGDAFIVRAMNQAGEREPSASEAPVRAHLERQDKILNHGIDLVQSQSHPWVRERAALVRPRSTPSTWALTAASPRRLPGPSARVGVLPGGRLPGGWIALAEAR